MVKTIVLGSLFFSLIISKYSRPNPLQYFLVPDIEVENGAEEEDLEDEDDDVDDVVEEEEGDGVEEEEEAEDDDEK